LLLRLGGTRQTPVAGPSADKMVERSAIVRQSGQHLFDRRNLDTP
jgi:hypothetical protein